MQFTAWANGLRWPLEPLLRLFLAAVLGGLVGLEREVRGRQAGFRTNLLVSLGCALVMIVSISFAYQPWPKSMGFTINVDPARVAYGVMAGIGFLGAGVIIKHEGSVRGLTRLPDCVGFERILRSLPSPRGGGRVIMALELTGRSYAHGFWTGWHSGDAGGDHHVYACV